MIGQFPGMCTPEQTADGLMVMWHCKQQINFIVLYRIIDGIIKIIHAYKIKFLIGYPQNDAAEPAFIKAFDLLETVKKKFTEQVINKAKFLGQVLQPLSNRLMKIVVPVNPG